MQRSMDQPDRPGLFSGLGRVFKARGLFGRGPAGSDPQMPARMRERAPGFDNDRRNINAVALLNSAHGDSAIADALAEALRLSTGSAIAVVLLPVHNTRAFAITSFSTEGDNLSLNILRGTVDTSAAARQAVEHGAAIGIGENLPADALPAWAKARKYTVGLVAPVTSGDHTFAIVYTLSQGTTPASVEQIEGVELLLSIAARHMGRPPVPTEPRNDTVPSIGAPQPAAVNPARPHAPVNMPVSSPQTKVEVERPVVRPEPVGQPSAAPTGSVPPVQSAVAPPSGTSPIPRVIPAIHQFGGAPLASGSAPTPTPIARFLPDRPSQRFPLTAAGLNLDPVRESVEILGKRVSLSSTEFSLLHALASAAHSPVTLSHLTQACWGETGTPSANAVEVALSRLRKRLARVPGGEGVICTLKGQGYHLGAPHATASAAPSQEKHPGSLNCTMETAAAAD